MQMIISKQIDLRCLLLTLGLFLSAICTTSAQELEPLRPVSKVPYQLDALQDSFLEWPDTTNAYASVDGHRMQTYVVEQQDISRRYRDTVNPQYWGRIIGASSDWESAEWLEQKYRDLELQDISIQPFDLTPQWFPQSWSVTVTVAGREYSVATAHPFYRSTGTDTNGVELELIYVGLGTEADFAGRDVAGKAVLISDMLGLPEEGALLRASEKGAAAIFNARMMPGNMRYQAYPVVTDVPTFTLGNEDGIALRELIEGDLVPKLKIKLDIDIVSGLQTAMVWGTLPGQTDETIYVMAHRDGFFDAAGDNAAGVASMIELAEYYAGIPAEERRRTLIFIGLDGHHNSGPGFGVGRMWLAENHENLFDKTALLINAEHPSTVQTIVRPRYLNRDEEIIWSNSYTAFHWYAGGSTRPELNRIALNAFREFGISTYLEPNPRAPAGDLSRVFQYVPGLTTTDYYHYFHSELETVETVPWTGLQNTTKAYARIIDEVNKLDLDVLKRPPGTGLDQ
ncbi:MAG: hypothetical protein CMQ15_10810 [Gammaproteobacteria bacterium]|jgi:hypothetical protein|nr:hypothetical protein [Gammaproteobacteria bacterium]